MTSIILIANGARPRLLSQTLETLYKHTPRDQFNLTVIWDGSNPVFFIPDDAAMLCMNRPCKIVGRLKNLGAYWSDKNFGRGEYVCFIDDDMAFFPGWLEKMTMVSSSMCASGNSILGGVRHSYHGVNFENHTGRFGWHATDAVAGYCHFMSWKTWDQFGPYDAHAKGTGQSEDWKLCNDIVKAGGRVGYIHPPVMAHCGVKNSEGKPAIGNEKIERIPGLIYE